MMQATGALLLTPLLLAALSAGCSDDTTTGADAGPDISVLRDGALDRAVVDTAPRDGPLVGPDTVGAHDLLGPVDLPGGADPIFVDPQISGSSCSTYDPAARSCGSGSRRAYDTLGGAAAVASPGDFVLIRAGTYAETLAPKSSGTKGQPITYRAYGAEKPTISGASLNPAIDISGREYLTIEGLTVDGVRRWLLGVDTKHVVLRGNRFLRALDPGGSSKTGLYFESASFNRVEANLIEDSTQDNLSLIKSDHNLIVGNTFRKAVHTLWTIKCGNENILRGNYFHNAVQKIGEIYDCDGVGINKNITLKDATRRNVVEDNDFAKTASSGDSSPYAGIQYAGQYGIIRRNRFYTTVGPGLDLTRYSGEAEHTHHNRVYHNVFYKTDFAGVHIAAGADVKDNILVNNVLAQSVFVANDTRWDWYTKTLAGKPVQIMVAKAQGFELRNNCLFGLAVGDAYVITQGTRTSSSNPPGQNVAWWITNHPALVSGSIELAPEFVDAGNADFRLKATSPLRDKGAFLTTTSGSGSGKTLKVADSGYFHDGFGIPGELGDRIQIEGGSGSARVVAVDRTAHTLTLDAALTWSDGKGVSLSFGGQAPDVGAHELP
jgi:hypothetical protein